MKSNNFRVGIVVGGIPHELNDPIISAYEIGKVLEAVGTHIEIITFDDNFEDSISYARIALPFITDATYLGTKRPRDLRKILDKLRIPYAGSPAGAANITKNKVLSKKCFIKAGLSTPR